MLLFRFITILLSLSFQGSYIDGLSSASVSSRIHAPQSLLTYISSIKRDKREEGRAPRHHANSRKWEEPRNVEESLYFSPEKFQVVSSNLRILPRKSVSGRSGRKKRSEAEWRKPRRHQFVTTSRVGKYLDPDPLRYYPGDRPFYRPAEFPRRSENRRIVYYATLPEIVKHPVDWSPPPPPRSDGYPSIHENEIVTRVQSPLIDVMGGGSRDSSYDRGYPPSKITIIDAEPPYYRYPPRYDPYYGPYNDPRNRPYYSGPYGGYESPPRVPERHVIIPPLPNSFTVVRKPLDVRPLDPIRDATTTAAPSVSSSTTASTTTLNPIRTFERTFKY